MLVSWEWLKQYLDLKISEAEVCDRLTLAGLNFDGASTVANDRCLDLEVTSNRPDWLGHIGIAREIGVLFDLDLQVPTADISATSTGGDLFCIFSLTCKIDLVLLTSRLLKLNLE